MDEEHQFTWRQVLPKFSISSLMWLSLVVAILILWYRDRTALQKEIAKLYAPYLGNREHWATKQAVGPADTHGFGDLVTAWASKMPDSGEEWLIVEFPWTVKAKRVDIHETYNPGAVIAIYGVSMTGAESLLWKGTDPLASLVGLGGVSSIPIDPPTSTRRIKIVLDSAGVPGWNEIDAVELVDSNGKKQWASNAWSSSAFGNQSMKPRWFFP